MKNIVHGFVLSLANLGSVIFGFAIYYLIKGPNQIIIQLPVAIVLSCIIFSTYLYIYSKIKKGKGKYISTSDCLRIYIYSLLCAPVIFIPTHFCTQGYMTSFENIVAIWLFQAVTNIIVIYISREVIKLLFNERVYR